jgi:hypothetical protein
VDLPGFVSAGVSDGLLAVAVGPAGAVGDHLAVVAGNQVAHDRLECVQLRVARADEAGAQIVAEVDVGAEGVGVAGAPGSAGLAVLFGGGAQLVLVEPGAGEVRLVAGLVVVGVLELLAAHVDHEHGVDDPHGGGEVAAALVDAGVVRRPHRLTVVWPPPKSRPIALAGLAKVLILSRPLPTHRSTGGHLTWTRHRQLDRRSRSARGVQVGLTP